jgi:Cu+-exporting ATPase
LAKDPVCGMNVNEQKAAGSSSYAGKTYYFCSTGCKSEFDKNPAKYAQ